MFKVKFAVISAINADTEFIVGQSMELPGALDPKGTNAVVLPRSDAVCDHVVASDETVVIKDARHDPRFTDHPALALWNTRFYAGAPLRTTDGLVLGALCLMDAEPRDLSEEELTLLNALAADVAAVIAGEEAALTEEPAPEKSSATTGQAVPS